MALKDYKVPNVGIFAKIIWPVFGFFIPISHCGLWISETLLILLPFSGRNN